MNRNPAQFVLMNLLLAAATVMLAGCATYDRQVVRGETFTINAPHAVLDSPEVVRLRTERPPTASAVATNDRGEPWWATRNDDRLAVRPGANQVRYQAYQIHVRDRQYSHDGKINNTYRREVRSFEHGQSGY